MAQDRPETSDDPSLGFAALRDRLAHHLQELQATHRRLNAQATVPRVLVVEDNAINQLVATSLLAALGLASDLAEDGAAALRKLSESRYDLVLMDCQMPEMDGWEATRRFREVERGPRVPVVALTASSTEADMDRCKACGMDDFLAKPIDLQVLSQLLHKHLGRA